MKSSSFTLMLIGASILIGCMPVQGRTNANQSERETKDVSLARNGAEAVRITTLAGNIRVVAANGDRIEVHQEKRVSAKNSSDARAFLKEMSVEQRQDGNRILLEAVWPKSSELKRRYHIDSASLNLEVGLPPGMRLEAETKGGNMQVSDVRESDLHTFGGNITLLRCAGVTKVHTNGGNIRIEQAAGPINAETGGGNITIQSSPDQLVAHTGGGNIQINGARRGVTATTGGGNIEADMERGSDSPQIELGTGAGQITLHLPEKPSAHLEADTGSGRVSLRPSSYGGSGRDRSRLSTDLGSGEGRIRLHTGAGDISINLQD